MAKKELHKINLLVAVIKDSGASDNEKHVSEVKVVQYCKKLINGAGIDAHKRDNWILSGLLRQLFEGKSIQLWHDYSDIEKIKKVLQFHKVSFNEKEKLLKLI
ncbi:hypothetical protein P5624_00045 (plasmid) [Bacillus subtilis]|nr:hypothetical protein P5624_00045 [Bacillus subtilis]